MTTSATGETSGGQVDTRQGSRRAVASRPRALVGRDREIAELIEDVALTPLTTVTGPGGVGKTALALAAAAASAAQFPDGVFVVWLASLRSAEHIAGEVAAQVGMPRLGGQSYEDALTDWLAERDVLLVLDNCEHVVSAVADLVEGLIARLPRLRVLATSREPLWVSDELTYRLAPLPLVGPDASSAEIDASPAVLLFRERAGARTQASLDTDRGSSSRGDLPPRRWAAARDRACGGAADRARSGGHFRSPR
jgi:predicted ATPase